MRDYQQLTITDDFIFRKVMTLNTEISKHLLEVILNVKIRKIKLNETQKIIDTTVDARGVRLDVYLEDDENSVYDIEMQTSEKRSLPKRSRYYQAMIDSNLLEKGELFSKIRRSYVIFICTFDAFNLGLPAYHFTYRCAEKPELELQDETTRIFLNATAWEKAEQEELRSLLHYIDDGIITDRYTTLLSNSVDYVKRSDQWRLEYMTLEMKLKEVREEGREEGIKEGIKEGKLELIFNLVKDKLLTLSDAAAQMHMSEEELRKLLKNN